MSGLSIAIQKSNFIELYRAKQVGISAPCSKKIHASIGDPTCAVAGQEQTWKSKKYGLKIN